MYSMIPNMQIKDLTINSNNDYFGFRVGIKALTTNQYYFIIGSDYLPLNKYWSTYHIGFSPTLS